MAYAAITCFMSTISLSLSDLAEEDKELIQVLSGKLDSLRILVEETDKITRDREAPKILEAQTMKVSYTAQDMLELELTRLAPMEIKESQGRSICECLQKVIEDVDSTAEEWMKMKNMYGKIKDLQPQTLDLGDSNKQHVLESKNVMVGYQNELAMILDQLVRGLGEEKVISLVGMGGIGKTTFATRIFDDPPVMSHFDVRAKVTVSQEYRLKDLYLGLLRYTSSRSEGLERKDDGELADLLQKSLKGRRYLVIVDDIWTTEAWDDIRMCFPFNNNGSRILLTTRNTEVAEYASSGMPPYQMRLLTFDECWNLLYHKVFTNECLTPEFEEIGKDIVWKCKGLPLATVVMAGVLLKISKSLDEWKKVAEDMNLLTSTDLDHYCLRVLALSYYHLPHHLRACLLYLVALKMTSEIPVSKLVRLWAAEGFVKLERDESFEMAAEKCLKELIDRSLVSVSSWSFYGKIKTCRIHDMIYSFCFEEAKSTNFLSIIMEKDVQMQPTILFHQHQRRISIQSSEISYQFGGDTCTKLHSAILYGSYRLSLKKLEYPCFKMLRVLDIISERKLYFEPNGIGGLNHLRYLAFTINQPVFFPDIANLKNLQTLIYRNVWFKKGYTDEYLPRLLVWGMSQLRHLKICKTYLDDPPPALILEHLHTLSGLNPKCCTPPVLQGISNVKRLQIFGAGDDYADRQPSGSFQYCDLSHLHQLESLSVAVHGYQTADFTKDLHLPPASSFSRNLKKLTLQRTCLPWKEMTTTVSKLPKLEVLQLKDDACRGAEWETIEDGFLQLKFLMLNDTCLALWKTSSDHFPCLERLFLKNCHSLVSIPQDFVDIFTLQVIDLNKCKSSVVESAKQIQQEVGDNVLDVRVRNPLSQEEEEEHKAKKEKECSDDWKRYWQPVLLKAHLKHSGEAQCC